MKHMFFLFAALSFISQANALGPEVPARAPKCGSATHIRSPKNGAGVLFNETCDIAFVLPPAEATIKVNGIGPNANVTKCPIVNGNVQFAVELQHRIDDALASLKPDTTPIDPDDPFSPPPHNRDVDLKKIGEIISEVMKLQHDLIDGMKDYENLEAGMVSVVFNMHHQDLVDQYASLNPQIYFLPLQLKSAVLSVLRRNIVESENLPAVLYANVAGFEFQKDHSRGDPLPNLSLGEENRYSNEPTGNYVFSGALPGTIVLSLAGGCAFYDPVKKVIDPKLSAQDLTSYLTAGVTYSYDLQASAKYHAEYNLTELVKKLVKSTTSGGFFSSSSAVDIINERNSGDWFKFTSEEEDSDFQISVTAKDVKADLIDRVIMQIGYVRLDSSGQIPDPAAPPVRGAVVAANEIGKCMHIYCQAVAIGLRVLDSIFGSSEAAQNFILNSNYWARDDVSQKRMIRYRGTLAFVPEKKNL